jgi:hypothetical protein
MKLVTIFIALQILLIGCAPASTTNTYNTFYFKANNLRFKYGGISLEHPLFTFEYPSIFEPTGVETLNDFPPEPPTFVRWITDVTFQRETHNIFYDSLGVDVYAFGALEYANSEDFINKYLSKMKREDPDNFKIIENISSTFQDIPATYLTYSYQTDNLSTKYYSFSSRYDRMVVFDYKGVFWKIYAFGDQNNSEEMNTYFQHLLDTFKFLPPYPEGLNTRTN